MRHREESRHVCGGRREAPSDPSVGLAALSASVSVRAAGTAHSPWLLVRASGPTEAMTLELPAGAEVASAGQL